jgi:uracil-DNA glycosylase
VVHTRRLQQLEKQIVACRLCPRLVTWREQVARVKVKRFAGEEYWGKPLPGFGDPRGRLLLVGLAPAAHGGNRTGRMFTGDDSGTWLFRALHKAGFANQPESIRRNDGLVLSDCFITAMVRCAPPDNKPSREEFRNCRNFLMKEVPELTNVRVVVGLGRIGFDGALRAFRDQGRISFDRMPAFGHGSVFANNGLTFIASYHPSRQNTNTKKLTKPMLDAIFQKARRNLQ